MIFQLDASNVGRCWRNQKEWDATGVSDLERD